MLGITDAKVLRQIIEGDVMLAAEILHEHFPHLCVQAFLAIVEGEGIARFERLNTDEYFVVSSKPARFYGPTSE